MELVEKAEKTLGPAKNNQQKQVRFGNGTSKHNNDNKRKRGDDRQPKSGNEGAHNCLLHGPNSSHSTDDCFALKNEAKRLKANAPQRKQPDEEVRFQEVNMLGNFDLQAAVDKAVEAAVAKERQKRKAEELNAFANLGTDVSTELELSDDADIGIEDLE